MNRSRPAALLVTHGILGEELVRTVASILGPQPDVATLSNSGISADALTNAIEQRARDYERVGLDDQMAPYLDVQIPLITIPIFPGKNITVIAEVVALNHLVKVYGYHPARALNDRLMESMRMKLLSNPLVRDDTE